MNAYRHLHHLAIPLIAAAACLVTARAVASTDDTTWQPQPFARYQGIIDRMPFGNVPPPPTAAELAAANNAKTPPPPWTTALKLCAINRTPAGGLMIGFIDNSQKPPESYYVERGESADGFTVKAASFEQETATIEKDGLSVDLKMGKGSPAAASAPIVAATPVVLPVRPPPAPHLPTAPTGRVGLIARPSQAGKPSLPGNLAMGIAQANKRREEIAKIKASGGNVLSYLEQVRERQAQEQAAQAAEEQAARDQIQDLASQMSAEQVAQREHEINFKLLQQGAKPVSDIQLSEEEDKSLVDLGVLPP